MEHTVMLRCQIRDISSDELYCKINWMPFSERVTYKSCLMMYEIRNSLSPDCLKSAAPVATKHDHNTRCSANGDLHTSDANLKYYTRSFQYESARLWITLSTNIQNSSPTLYLCLSKCLKKIF